MDRPMPENSVYTGFLGDIVRTLEPYSEADPVGVLGALLSGFSAAVGGGVRVEYGTQAQSLAVWSVLIGKTGQGRKGTAVRSALGVVSTALPDWANAALLEGCPQSGPAYVSTLADMGGQALMIEEEFADLLKVSARYKNMGKALRRTWEGASVSNRTKEAVIEVARPHVSIIGNVTPTEWGSCMSNADKAGGTINRFLPLYVERSKRIKLSEQVSRAELDELIEPLVEGMQKAVFLARNRSKVTLSPEAVKLWDHELCEEIESVCVGREAMEQFAARGTDQAMRTAALYALADQRDQISPNDLEAAVALVAYMAESVTFLMPEVAAAQGGEVQLPINGDPGKASETTRAKVVKILREAGPDGIRSTRLYRNHNIDKDDLENALAGVPHAYKVKLPSQGGRPQIVYRLIEPDTPDDHTPAEPEQTPPPERPRPTPPTRRAKATPERPKPVVLKPASRRTADRHPLDNLFG